MTRINVVPVWELSDQHLIAEYHELPRVLKQNINITDAPDKYCLGKGHMKWAKRFGLFTSCRYGQILAEMEYRGFKTNYGMIMDCNEESYRPTQEDIELNRNRLREKYQLKPNWYHLTKRTKPSWL